MFKQIIRKLQALSVEPVLFDPSTLNDEVALNTEWTPLRSGGASFQTHRLLLERPNRIAFRATCGGFLFCAAFVALGLVAMAVGQFAAEIPRWTRVLITVVGVVFIGGAGVLLGFWLAPTVFDVNRGFYSRGWFGRQHVAHDDIYALQLISEYCRGHEHSFYSYELNLVLDDGRRVNVVDHGNLSQVRTDAQMISQRLNVPVWDAVDH